MLRFHELPLPRLPAEGGLLENWQISRRLDYAKRNHLVLRVPKVDRVLDEYSSVPFLSEDGRVFLYDSSSLGHWLDSRATEERSLLYPGDPALRFIAQLIDEAAFEKSRALYDGELLGHAFRAVVKTFQVRVWATLCEEWRGLSEQERNGLCGILPGSEHF